MFLSETVQRIDELGFVFGLLPHPSISRWRITITLIFIRERHITTLIFIHLLNIYQG